MFLLFPPRVLLSNLWLWMEMSGGCFTEMRMDPTYISVYITWMYLIFIYTVPFGGLCVLNTQMFLDVRYVMKRECPWLFSKYSQTTTTKCRSRIRTLEATFLNLANIFCSTMCRVKNDLPVTVRVLGYFQGCAPFGCALGVPKKARGDVPNPLSFGRGHQNLSLLWF